jgi:hypothetical protein
MRTLNTIGYSVAFLLPVLAVFVAVALLVPRRGGDVSGDRAGKRAA